MEAKALLETQRPLVREYSSEGIEDNLISGEAWIALGWSGDFVQAQRKNPDIHIIIPEKGTLAWVDYMVILKSAPNPALAHQFADFFMSPDVARQNALYVGYATPNLKAKERLDTETLSNTNIYPPKELIDRCQWLRHRGPDSQLIDEWWTEVKNSKK
jgi:spermidine/putrescine-binding protein